MESRTQERSLRREDSRDQGRHDGSRCGPCARTFHDEVEAPSVDHLASPRENTRQVCQSGSPARRKRNESTMDNTCRRLCGAEERIVEIVLVLFGTWDFSRRSSQFSNRCEVHGDESRDRSDDDGARGGCDLDVVFAAGLRSSARGVARG